MLKPRYHELSMKWMLGSEGAASKGAWKRFKDQEEAIDREEQAFEEGGLVTTPKRGLVDGPGSYAGLKEDFNRNPSGINQHKIRTFEEIQEAIYNAPPKYVTKKDGTLKRVPVTPKDLYGEGKNYPHKIVARTEYDLHKDKLDIEGKGKPVVEDFNKSNKVRYAKNKLQSNTTILAKMAGTDGYHLSHLSLTELDSLKNLGYLPKDINIKQYHSFEKKIVANAKEIYATQNNKSLSLLERRAEIAKLQKIDRALRKEFPKYANTKARLKVQANNLEVSGLKIGEKLPDPTVAISQTEGTLLKDIKAGSKKEKEIIEKAKINLLKKMGYRCLKDAGGAEDVGCYLEDVKKTRKDLRSTNVEVRAKALTKQRAAKKIAEKIPGMSKMIKGARGTLAYVGGLPGIVFEGLFEVGAYDYYRRKGYNHEEASAEALFFGKMAGVGGDKTGLLEGADKLIEKRIAGTEPARLKYISNLNKNLGDQDKLYNDISSLNKVLVEGSQFTTPEMKKEVEDELELKMEELTKLENKSNLKTPGYDAWLIGQEKLDHEHGMAGEAYIKNRYGLPESEEATQKRLDAKYPRRLQEMRTYKTGVGPGSKFWTADIPEDISKMEPGFLHDYYEKDLGYKPEEVISQKWKDIYGYGGFDELDKVGIAGGYSKMAKGGIATLSGKRSKPMPQGLNYLMRKK